MRKRIHIFVTLAILFFSISFTVYAHPGKTDKNRGHYDRSTGEYHYHHGYPAHQHIDGECPYNFDDKTGINNGINSTTQKSVSTQKTAVPQTKINTDSEKTDWVANFLIFIFYLWPIFGIVGLAIKEDKQQKKIAYYNTEFKKRFGHCKHPYTAKPIETVQEYIDAVCSTRQNRSIITNRKVTINELNKQISMLFSDYFGYSISNMDDYLKAFDNLSKENHTK